MLRAGWSRGDRRRLTHDCCRAEVQVLRDPLVRDLLRQELLGRELELLCELRHLRVERLSQTRYLSPDYLRLLLHLSCDLHDPNGDGRDVRPSEDQDKKDEGEDRWIGDGGLSAHRYDTRLTGLSNLLFANF
jgi:hypothetical protein